MFRCYDYLATTYKPMLTLITGMLRLEGLGFTAAAEEEEKL